jgi:predicted Zn-dependent protease
MRFFWKSADGGPPRAPELRARPFLEQLESRIVPYALSGGAWPDPQLITLSFMPDGTLISSGSNGNSYSDMYAVLGKTMSVTTWENAIISAAQTWAQYANVNFTVVADNGTPAGQGSFQQGDPGMGDIRFGGYEYATSYLGEGFMPPPVNNYSIAGDIDFNTAKTWNNGYTYDLQTVALHEIGHALGLGHSTVSSAVMWPCYNGVKRSLTADDIAGVQAIYGARAPDAYAGNNSFVNATQLDSPLNLTQATAQLDNLDIVSTTDDHYFAFTAPTLGSGLLGSGTLAVTVQSTGLSLLRPQVNVYVPDILFGYDLVGTASGSGYNGSTITVNLTGVNPLETFYIEVSGADNTAFSTGDYALSVSVGGASLPPVALPNTQLLDGTVIQSGGGLSEQAIGDGMAANSSFPDADLSHVLPGITAAQAALPMADQYLELAQLLPYMQKHGNGCHCPMCMMALSNLHEMAATTVSLSQVLDTGLSSVGSVKGAGTATGDLLKTAQTDLLHGRKGLDLVHQANGSSHATTPGQGEHARHHTFDASLGSNEGSAGGVQ